MDLATWANARGSPSVGLLVGSTICAVLLIGFTVMRINDASWDPGIDPTLIAVAGAILWTAGKKIARSGSGSQNA